MEKYVSKLSITNPNRSWVAKELEKLIAEWEEWQMEVATIQDYPYNQQTQLDVFADGEENMNKHDILQTKTLVFLNNNIEGHGFISGLDGRGCDRIDLRLSSRVKHRLQELRVLQASLQYATVPDSFWKNKGTELVDTIFNLPKDLAAKIAGDWLKNPPL